LKEGGKTGKKSLKEEVKKGGNCSGEGVTADWNNQMRLIITKNCKKKTGKKRRHYLVEGVTKNRNCLVEGVIKDRICLVEGVVE
jgi:hypothetical protein